MIKNYLLTAFRNWTTHKLFTAINIGGLAVGLTCAVFIILFVRAELSYDRWIPDSANIYRVEFTAKMPGQPISPSSLSPFPVPPAMVTQIPEVKDMTHLVQQDVTVGIGDREFLERIDVVDPQFFKIIKLPLTNGDPSTVFSKPDSAVISQSVARKYFGTESGIIGQVLDISGSTCTGMTSSCDVQKRSVVVTGILRDLPQNTQLSADIVIPNTSSADLLPRQTKESWTSSSGWGFVLLAPGANPEAVLTKLKAIEDLTFEAMGAGALHASDFLIPHLTRFWDDHLTTDRYQSMTPPGNRTTVYGFAVIGALIILVACFNFTNLAVARASLRSREISLRKVLGAHRSQIVAQFLGEAILMAMAAAVLTLAMVQPLMPFFDRLLSKPIVFDYLAEWRLVLAIFTVAIFAGLLGGIYPAFALSKFKPAAALRNNAAQVTGSGRFRGVLVILQFAVSIGLAIAAVVVFMQISYARHVDLGFSKDNVLVIRRVDNISATNRESFLNALRQYSGVVNAALSGPDVPFLGNRSSTGVQFPGASAAETMRTSVITPEFTSTYKVRLLSGRFLSDQHGADRFTPGSSSINVLVNASAARRLGFAPAQAVGKTFTITDARLAPRGWNMHAEPFRAIAVIVGVVDDMKMEAPRQLVANTVYFDVPGTESIISVKMRPEHLSQTLAFIDKTWSQFAPGFAIQRQFLSDAFNKEFLGDERQGVIFTIFVGIAIFIACLGLFGLAAFTAERRSREIGLRKTFGAKTRHIVLLLLWQFSIPVLIANVVAWPLAYYYLHGWLESYADRISLNPFYFVAAGAAALLIAWATVYAHAFRMARANPINALRYE